MTYSNEIKHNNTEHQIKTTAEDFLKIGLENGSIGERELAQWIVRGLDFDTDAVKRLISYLSEEQSDYIVDFYRDEADGNQKHKELIKIDNASGISHVFVREYGA